MRRRRMAHATSLVRSRPGAAERVGLATRRKAELEYVEAVGAATSDLVLDVGTGAYQAEALGAGVSVDDGAGLHALDLAGGLVAVGVARGAGEHALEHHMGDTRGGAEGAGLRVHVGAVLHALRSVLDSGRIAAEEEHDGR